MKNFLKGILKSDFVRGMGSFLLTQYVRLAWVTGRWSVHGGEFPNGYWDRGEPFILTFWHGRILMMPKAWRKGVPINMLISRHRDGELITRAVKPLGIGTIRGSAAKPGSEKDKGGLGALREILKSVKSGQCPGITPDGPRGPRMRASDGVAAIARMSGAPVIPGAWSARRRVVLKSWDRFVIPMPFTRGVIVWGEPISVARDADASALEIARVKIEDALNAVTAKADELAGVEIIRPADVLAANEAPGAPDGALTT
jgi:lysophospholipid acyltransferase (LPLAT)-like uncharacterized protein